MTILRACAQPLLRPSRGSRSRRWRGRSPRRRGARRAAGSRSSRSSSAGHRVDERAALVDRQARPRAPRSPRSRCRSARRPPSCAARSIAFSSSASSTSGIPALTSSTSAPAATCASASAATRRQVAVAQLLGEHLAAGRVDALADDAERLLGADRDGPSTATASDQCSSQAEQPLWARRSSISSLAFLTAEEASAE